MRKTLLVCAACVILASAASAQTGFTAVSEMLGTHCATCHQWAASFKGIAAGALPNDSPPYPAASKEQPAPVPEPCPCGLE